MDNKIIEKHKDIFRCPDTGEDLWFMPRSEDEFNFVNKFETKFHVKGGIADFVGQSSINTIVSPYKENSDSLTDTYEDFMTSDDFFSGVVNHLLFGSDLNVVPFKNVMSVFLTELQEGLILDMPVMTGLLAGDVYHHFPRMTFVAADYPADAISLCYDRIKIRDSNNAMLVQADPRKLPFKDEIFDAVTSVVGINFMKEYKKAFEEIFRVLKKGGRFAGTAFVMGKKAIADQVVEKIVKRKGFFDSIFTLGEMENALTDAGFVDITIARFESDSMIKVFANKK